MRQETELKSAEHQLLELIWINRKKDHLLD
jgi:hypothetical protein